MPKNKNQNGFIPMLILILAVVAGVIWLGYHRVSTAHKNKVINTVQQNENLINR